jgi:hypothetical protein
MGQLEAQQQGGHDVDVALKFVIVLSHKHDLPEAFNVCAWWLCGVDSLAPF